MLGAAYGLVPRDFGPEQVARDGEDYAAFVVGMHGHPPMELHTDCMGTYGCLLSKAKATSIKNPRCAFWDKFWRDRDEGSFKVNKVKEERDEAGQITLVVDMEVLD